jgi:hypothetical protein
MHAGDTFPHQCDLCLEAPHAMSTLKIRASRRRQRALSLATVLSVWRNAAPSLCAS